jgi:hypothetical protein
MKFVICVLLSLLLEKVEQKSYLLLEKVEQKSYLLLEKVEQKS